MSDSLIYLEITFEKANVLKGESTVSGFKKQIELESFKWGMSVDEVRDEGSQRGSSGVKFETLDLVGFFDFSTTGMLTALRERDKIVTANLSVIHAVQPKDRPKELLIIKISDGYVEDLQIDISSGKVTQAKVNLKLSYKEIDVKYFPATRSRDDRGGSVSFNGQVRTTAG